MRDKQTWEQVLKKMYSYCAYRERSCKEAQIKLSTYHLSSEDNEVIMARLLTDRYLDDERFARTFAHGKFSINKWGRIKITQHLRTHDLSEACIHQGLKTIDENTYCKTLATIIAKKDSSDKEQSPQRLLQHLLRKGYEQELIQREIAKQGNPKNTYSL